MCLSDGGYTVQFQALAIQQIALHAHEKIAPCSLSFNYFMTFSIFAILYEKKYIS